MDRTLPYPTTTPHRCETSIPQLHGAHPQVNKEGTAHVALNKEARTEVALAI
jgi:hypothetical protein